MFPGSLNLLQVLDVFHLAQFVCFFLQHFAVADDGVERSAQFVAHIREKRALGPVGILSCVLGVVQFRLHLLTPNDFAFQLQGPGLELIIGVMQCRIPLLDFGQHRVEPVDEPSDFVAVKFGGANFIAFCGGNHAHRIFQVQNRSGNQFLELGRYQQREEAGDQDEA